MSVSIVEILAGDKGLDLQNGYWARQPIILGNWQTIRIGARFHVPVTSSVSTSLNFFKFGMCSGTTNVPGKVASADVDNALYFQSVNTTWTYNSSGAVLLAGSGSSCIGKNESGTTGSVTLSGVGAQLGAISSSPSVIRSAYVATISKGSPFTFRADRRTSTVGGDISLATLYAAMEAADPDVVLGTGYADNSTTITMDEGTHGTLDTVFVTWAQSSPPIYVSEILVARLA